VKAVKGGEGVVGELEAALGLADDVGEIVLKRDAWHGDSQSERWPFARARLGEHVVVPA
jgi:hypothetical protein